MSDEEPIDIEETPDVIPDESSDTSSITYCTVEVLNINEVYDSREGCTPFTELGIPSGK